jgi:hypothetical protein
MKTYQFIPTTTQHTLKQIFENYAVTKEVEFVKTFFSEENIMNIISECGLEKPERLEDFVFEYPVKFGISSYRADLVVESESSCYYFEVMSTSNKGVWDQDHHLQFFLKHTKLNQMYDDVKSFAVSFGEFDPRFSEEICKMENTFGVHLEFTDYGFKINVICKEQKKVQQNLHNELCLEFWGRTLQNIKKTSSFFNNSNPTTGKWISKTVKKVAKINSVVSGSYVRLEVYIDRQTKDMNKEVYHKLLMNKEKIENELGYQLNWEILDHSDCSRISISQDGDFRNKEKWNDMIEFLSLNVENFQKTFSKYL